MIIALTGFMGSGKSSVGQCLANLMELPFVDLDDAVLDFYSKKYHSDKYLSIADIFASKGEGFFRKLEYECLKELIDSYDQDSSLVIALGGGAFIQQNCRELLLERTKVVYLKASLPTIKSRLAKPNPSRPLFSNADALYAEREPIYSLSHITVTSEGVSIWDVTQLILKGLNY